MWYLGRRKCYTAFSFPHSCEVHVPTKTWAEGSSAHTIGWLGGRCPAVYKVEGVEMLEPNMPLQQPKSSLVNNSNPETPKSKHRQSESLLSQQEWSLAAPVVACSRNVYWEARSEVNKENIKGKSTHSWLRFEIFKSQYSEYIICGCKMLHNKFLYRPLKSYRLPGAVSESSPAFGFHWHDFMANS